MGCVEQLKGSTGHPKRRWNSWDSWEQPAQTRTKDSSSNEGREDAGDPWSPGQAQAGNSSDSKWQPRDGGYKPWRKTGHRQQAWQQSEGRGAKTWESTLPRQHSTLPVESVAAVAGRFPRMDGLFKVPRIPRPVRAGPLDVMDLEAGLAKRLSAKMSGLINFGHVYCDPKRGVEDFHLQPHLRASGGACALQVLVFIFVFVASHARVKCRAPAAILETARKDPQASPKQSQELEKASLDMSASSI